MADEFESGAMRKRSISDFGRANETASGRRSPAQNDMAQMRADSAKVESELAALDAKVTRLENDLEAFRRSVDDRLTSKSSSSIQVSEH
jgi:predicted  nucleic acid-binding Zn-ribbon protein